MSKADAAVWRAACELAGRLAESGVARLTLRDGSEERVLEVRQTDLPRELMQARIGAFLMWDGGAMVRASEGWREALPTDQPLG